MEKKDPLRMLGKLFSPMQLSKAEKKINTELEKAILYAKSKADHPANVKKITYAEAINQAHYYCFKG